MMIRHHFSLHFNAFGVVEQTLFIFVVVFRQLWVVLNATYEIKFERKRTASALDLNIESVER